MSLSGLDAEAVVQAYQHALAEVGGWFLLKYTSRDTVDLLGRGNGGVSEARRAAAGYEEKSPLYGLVQYRRKKIILKYVPEGTSRLLQVRLAVQFQSILDAFNPHDTVFSFTAADELTESALGLSAMLRPTGSKTSSSSSLRQQRLNEIAEDNEENANVEKASTLLNAPSPPDLVNSTALRDNQEEDGLPASAVRAKALLAKRRQESSEFDDNLLIRRPSHISEHQIEEIRQGSQKEQTAAAGPFPTRSSSKNVSKRLPAPPPPPPPAAAEDVPPSTHDPKVEVYVPRPSVDYPLSPFESDSDDDLRRPTPKEYSQPRPASRLSAAESTSISKWTEEVVASTRSKQKRRPRESQSRPQTSGTTDEYGLTRRVANLPASVRVSARPSGQSSRPGSQQSTRSVPTRWAPSPSLPPPLPSPTFPASANRAATSRAPPSRASSFTADHPTVTPEKMRLMKALQMRKRNQVLAQRAASALLNTPANPLASMDSSNSAVSDLSPPRAAPETSHDRGSVPQPPEPGSIILSETTSPTSILTVSDTPSTKHSSVSEQSAGDQSSTSISSDTNSSTTPKADPEEQLPQTERSNEPVPEPETVAVTVVEKTSESVPAVETPATEGDLARPTEENQAGIVLSASPENCAATSAEEKQGHQFSTVASDQAEVEEASPVARDQVEAEEASPVAGDQAEVEEASPVASDQAEAEEASPVAGDQAEVEEASPVARDQVEAEEASPVASDQAEAENLSPVAGDQAEVEEASPVARDQVEAEEASPVASDHAEAEKPSPLSPPKKRYQFEGTITIPPRTTELSDVSDDESLAEELQHATVEEAKPVAVSRTHSPVTPIFSRVPTREMRDVTPVSTIMAKSPSAPDSSPATTPDRRRTASRAGSVKSLSTALPQWPPPPSEPLPALPKQKPSISASISKRIKAFEGLSQRHNDSSTAGSQRDPSPRAASTPNVLKRTSFLTQSNGDRTPDKAPTRTLPSPLRSEFEASGKHETARPWVQRPNTGTEIYSPTHRGESVSVTARIVRDPSKPASAHGTSDTTTMYRSPLIVEHEPSTLLDLPPPLPREMTSQSVDALAASLVSEPRRFSFSSYRSNTKNLSPTESKSSRMLLSGHFHKTPKSPSETSSMADEKRSSRTSRMLKRLSGLGRSGNRESVVTSPTQENIQQDTIQEQTETPESHMRHVVDIGDVNVQFADTLLWKRRFLRVDDNGYLIFAAPANEHSLRGTSRKIHLDELLKPALPDLEREEMAWSIILDLKSGGTVQCACESKAAQASVLKMLIDAHAAYHQLYSS